jgi:hypothetical protein
MSDLDISLVPGTVTHIEQPANAEGSAGVDHDDLRRRGYEWISFQLVNGTTINPIDIHKFPGPYPSVGCWGATYDVTDFYEFGRRLGREAVRQGADHVIADLEECAKYTRDNRGMKPVIDGLRAAGWTGPVHLSTLGAPVNAIPHGGNDFGMDVESFLETGGGVQPQAYYNNYDEYRPDLCVDYWKACGVPEERINVCIEVSKAEAGTAKQQALSGADWVPLLKDAGVHRNFNIFMTQFCYQADWDALNELSLPRAEQPPEQPKPPTTNGGTVTEPPATTAPAPPTGAEARTATHTAARFWQTKVAWPDPVSRATITRRIASPSNDDAKWKTCRSEIAKLLDDAGIDP